MTGDVDLLAFPGSPARRARLRPSSLSLCAAVLTVIACLLGGCALTDPDFQRFCVEMDHLASMQETLESEEEAWDHLSKTLAEATPPRDGLLRLTWPGSDQAALEASFQDGALHGPFRTWRADGVPWIDAGFDRADLHGSYRAWRSDGTLWHFVVYEHGRSTGGVFITRDGSLIPVRAEEEPSNPLSVLAERRDG